MWTLISTAQSDQPVKASATGSASQSSTDVPVIDGGLGICSLELSVTTKDGKPVYAATVRVHIAYGFGGFHRLDLQASTNANGKVSFIGLPSRLRRPPLEFSISKENLLGTVTYDPSVECHAKRDVPLDLPKPPN